jgi:hypothetical protein
MPLSRFHPLIAEWFTSSVWTPIDVQAQGLGSFIVFHDGVVVRSVIGLKSHSGEADLGGSLPAVARSR